MYHYDSRTRNYNICPKVKVLVLMVIFILRLLIQSVLIVNAKLSFCRWFYKGWARKKYNVNLTIYLRSAILLVPTFNSVTVSLVYTLKFHQLTPTLS